MSRTAYIPLRKSVRVSEVVDRRTAANLGLLLNLETTPQVTTWRQRGGELEQWIFEEFPSVDGDLLFRTEQGDEYVWIGDQINVCSGVEEGLLTMALSGVRSVQDITMGAAASAALAAMMETVVDDPEGRFGGFRSEPPEKLLERLRIQSEFSSYARACAELCARIDS